MQKLKILEVKIFHIEIINPQTIDLLLNKKLKKDINEN